MSIDIYLYLSLYLMQCTKTCGTGTQVREVRCYLNGAPVGSELCNPRTKYELNDILRTCSMEPCRFYPDVTVSNQIASNNLKPFNQLF